MYSPGSPSQKFLGILNSLKWETEGQDWNFYLECMKWHALVLARMSLNGLSLLLVFFLKKSCGLRSFDVFSRAVWGSDEDIQIFLYTSLLFVLLS